MSNRSKKNLQNIIYDGKVNYFLRRLITLCVPFPKYRRIWRLQIWDKYYRYQINKLVKETYPDAYVFFSRNSIGDVFFIASLIKEFKKTHPGKVVYLTEKESIANFLKSFQSIDEVICDRFLGDLQHIPAIQRKPQKGKLNFLFVPYRGSKPNYTFADDYANLLGVPLDSQRELPQITDKDKESAHNEFKKLDIDPQKTIILIPECTMFKYDVLKPIFWKKLAKSLEAKGFDVVFNSSNKAYKKFKSSLLPLNAFIAFAAQVKHIYSFRAGIDDLLVGTGITHLTAIYPNHFEISWADKFFFDHIFNQYHTMTKEYELDNLMQIYSLHSIFNKNINEIIFDNSEEDLLHTLINTDDIMRGDK